MDDNAEEADSHTVTAVDRASQSGPRPSSPAFTLRATPGRSDAQGTATSPPRIHTGGSCTAARLLLLLPRAQQETIHFLYPYTHSAKSC